MMAWRSVWMDGGEGRGETEMDENITAGEANEVAIVGNGTMVPNLVGFIRTKGTHYKSSSHRHGGG